MRTNRLLAGLLWAGTAWAQFSQSGGAFPTASPLAGTLENFLKVSVTTEAAGQFHSHYLTTGRPGAGAAPASGMAGAAITSRSGQIPFTNAAAGNRYLSMFHVSAAVTGTYFLYDRLWDQSGIVVATLTAQTINSATWPARDSNGSTNGEGVEIWLEVFTTTTNAGAITNTTMSYTNQTGVAGRVGTVASFPITGVAGTMVPFTLQAGDTGVRSVQTITLGTSYGAGAIGLVALRRLTSASILLANTGDTIDHRFSLVKCWPNTVPMLMQLATGTNSGLFLGQVQFVDF